VHFLRKNLTLDVIKTVTSVVDRMLNGKSSQQVDTIYHYQYFFLLIFLMVFHPKGTYNGQKLTKLVRRNTKAKIISTIPGVPEIIFVKYKIAMINASSTRSILSVVPIFLFIVFDLNDGQMSVVISELMLTCVNLKSDIHHDKVRI
jgi:hypothetical protein